MGYIINSLHSASMWVWFIWPESLKTLWEMMNVFIHLSPYCECFTAPTSKIELPCRPAMTDRAGAAAAAARGTVSVATELTPVLCQDPGHPPTVHLEGDGVNAYVTRNKNSFTGLNSAFPSGVFFKSYGFALLFSQRPWL